jgi:hypothetical protein
VPPDGPAEDGPPERRTGPGRWEKARVIATVADAAVRLAEVLRL